MMMDGAEDNDSWQEAADKHWQHVNGQAMTAWQWTSDNNGATDVQQRHGNGQVTKVGSRGATMEWATTTTKQQSTNTWWQMQKRMAADEQH
jgi:hypothetical protein